MECCNYKTQHYLYYEKTGIINFRNASVSWRFCTEIAEK